MESELDDSLCIMYENIVPQPEVQIVKEIGGCDLEKSVPQVEFTSIDSDCFPLNKKGISSRKSSRSSLSRRIRTPIHHPISGANNTLEVQAKRSLQSRGIVKAKNSYSLQKAVDCLHRFKSKRRRQHIESTDWCKLFLEDACNSAERIAKEHEKTIERSIKHINVYKALAENMRKTADDAKKEYREFPQSRSGTFDHSMLQFYVKDTEEQYVSAKKSIEFCEKKLERKIKVGNDNRDRVEMLRKQADESEKRSQEFARSMEEII